MGACTLTHQNFWTPSPPPQQQQKQDSSPKKIKKKEKKKNEKKTRIIGGDQVAQNSRTFQNQTTKPSQQSLHLSSYTSSRKNRGHAQYLAF